MQTTATSIRFPAAATFWILLFTLAECALAQTDAPQFTVQPRDASVSLGAKVTLRAAAGGVPTPSLQWRRDGLDLPQATQTTLVVSNVTLGDAGRYDVLAWSEAGRATSAVAVLTVDPAFTKIVTGLVATDGGDSSGVAWGDADNDGHADLFVGNGGSRNFFYHNRGDGTFDKWTNAAPALASGYGGSWGDYDNDGHLDLFVANRSVNYLFHNNGDGTFTKVAAFAGAAGNGSWSGSWADYDRDGWLDLFISNGGGNNALLRNQGDGTFARVAAGPIVSDGGNTIGAVWQDIDGDGWPDLYVANNGGRSFLYRNLRDGAFQRVATGAIATNSQSAIVADWGDYDNDGRPDLAVGCLGRNLLFRNLGDGTLAKVTEGPWVRDAQNSEIAQWVDFDNDGWLDLFSANNGGQNNTLYRNQGDGTFARILSGSLVNDGGNSAGCAWADYDNNGFLDLFVANWQGSRPNFLYRNNGNSNHWLKVRCVGAASNRSGIGAQVRVTAIIQGKERSQRREISGGSGFGQTSPLAHFGLGDAPRVETLRIDWPSGATQELRGVEVDQALTVVEPPALSGARWDGGAFELDVIGLPGATYTIESCTQLDDWSVVGACTNTVRATRYRAAADASSTRRFFRARVP